jgi:hypothetical protein
MIHDAVMLSLIIDAPAVSLPGEVSEEQLFSHFKHEIIELLQKDSEAINYFGLVPDNGADGIDELRFDGITFHFDVSQIVLDIDLDAELPLVRKAFLNIIEKFKPSSTFILCEKGETKVETMFVF